MKAISLWQPWASLWVRGFKRFETRHWPLRHRGPLAVHAALNRMIGSGEAWDRAYGPLERSGKIPNQNMLPRGALLGIVDIVDCREMTECMIAAIDAEYPDELAFGDWRPGRYAWVAENFRPFDYAVRWSGRQGLWDVPDEAVQKALAA